MNTEKTNGYIQNEEGAVATSRVSHLVEVNDFKLSSNDFHVPPSLTKRPREHVTLSQKESIECIKHGDLRKAV